MSRTDGNTQALHLMEALRRLVDGNHARASELKAKGLRQDSYPVDAWVQWRFGHQVSSRSVHGDGAVPNAHFGFSMDTFQEHLDTLSRDAASHRELRVPFMQAVTVAKADALKLSSKPQLVRDYGACSVCRHCDSCGGTGAVACSGCHGTGECRCTHCGGSGQRTASVHRTRWNGRYSESYVTYEQQNCYGCYGSGRRVCGSCGGCGRQRCGQCSGHGYFTDIVETCAVARPQWRVRAKSGLAHELLQDFMIERGASAALDSVPSLSLLDTEYDDEDRWIVHYRGEAEVIEQDIALRDQSWMVPAVGPKPLPMQHPPLFDYLFFDEIAQVHRLKRTRERVNMSARVARRLFRAYRAYPALDQAIQRVAALTDTEGQVSAHAVSASMQSFVSKDSAADLGAAMQGILHKVSPPYSALAWTLVMATPISGVMIATAMDLPYVSNWLDALLGVAIELLLGCLGVLSLAPVAWLLSSLISGLRRLRVPKSYRRKGRNWLPLRRAMQAVLLAAIPGSLYGFSVRYLHMPPVEHGLQTLVSWMPSHMIPSPLADIVATISPTDRTATYRAIQHYLNRHGYPVGPEDGLPGPRTRRQIKRYLRRHHLSQVLPPKAIWADMRQRR